MSVMNLSEDEQQRIKRWLEMDVKNPSALVPQKDEKAKQKNVTSDLCDSMREHYHQNETTTEAMESVYEFERTTIRRHVFGRCSCANDIEALESANSGFERRPVDREECYEHRQHYQDLTSYERVAEEHDRAVETIRRHVTGKCAHENIEIPPKKG